MNAAEQLCAEGRPEGLEGLRTGIVVALSARGVPLSEMGRARLASYVDVATLTQWLTRAVTAGSEGDVFGGSGAPSLSGRSVTSS